MGDRASLVTPLSPDTHQLTRTLHMKTFCLIALLALAFIGCGGAGGADNAPAADEAKTPAEVTVAVKTQETPALEKAVTAYKAEVKDLGTQVEDLKAQVAKKVEEAMGSGLDGLLGKEGASADLKAEAEKLKLQLADLEAHWKDLQAKLNIYVQELASRVGG